MLGMCCWKSSVWGRVILLHVRARHVCLRYESWRESACAGGAIDREAITSANTRLDTHSCLLAGGSTCEPCPANTYNADSGGEDMGWCIPCDAGWTSDAGATDCTPPVFVSCDEQCDAGCSHKSCDLLDVGCHGDNIVCAGKKVQQAHCHVMCHIEHIKYLAMLAAHHVIHHAKKAANAVVDGAIALHNAVTN